MEIVAALYLKANHDHNNPEWKERDRIIWSSGHKAPALYLRLAFAGYFPIEDIFTLRRFWCTVEANQGVRSHCRAHRAEGGRVDRHCQDEERRRAL